MRRRAYYEEGRNPFQWDTLALLIKGYRKKGWEKKRLSRRLI